MLDKSVRIHLVAALCICALVRLYGIRNPLSEMQYWRQTDTAAIARNFYGENSNIFYPRVNWRGDTSGYVESGFPLYSWIVSMFYRWNGGVNETLGRLVSLGFACGAALWLFLLALRLFEVKTAFYAAVFFSLAPVSVFYTRAFMQESTMLFFYLWGLYAFVRWTEHPGAARFFRAWLPTALALAVKLTAAVVLIPMAALAWHRWRGNRGMLFKTAFFFFLAALPAAAWYAHAYGLYLETGLSFGVLGSQGYGKFRFVEVLGTADYWKRIFFRLFGTVLTPLGGSLFFLGAAAASVRRDVIGKNRFLFAWLFSTVLFTLVVAEGNRLLEYYQLFWVPVAAVFIARMMRLLESMFPENNRRTGKRAFVLCVYSWIALSTAFFIHEYYAPRDYPERCRAFASRIKGATPENALFVVVDSEGGYRRGWYEKMGQRISSPSFLYFLNRNGWVLLPHELNEMAVEDFRQLVRRGGRYLLVPKKILFFYDGVRRFVEAMSFPVVRHDDSFVLFELDEALAPKKS
jgi:hypothetical protein